MAVILAIDLGTSSVKASYIDHNLKILAEASCPYPTSTPFQGASEQDPQDWWQATISAVQALNTAAASCPERVEVIGISGHMLGMLPVDRSGQPLGPALIHSDTRAKSEKEFLASTYGADEIYKRTGNVLSSASTLCKCLWFKHEHPELYQRTYKFIQSKDYLLYRMTGVFSTDYSDASHALLIDLSDRKYMSDLLQELKIDTELFPDLHASHEIAGYLSPEAAQALALPQGVPVSAGGGDGACSTLGAGVVHSDEYYCSLGTTAWIANHSAEPFFDPKNRVYNIMSLDGESYGIYGSMESACRSVDWTAELFGIDDLKEFDQEAAQVPPGSEGLVFLPYLEGERAPVFDSKARGVYFGMHVSHRREHFLRASLEGVALALRSILQIHRDQKPIHELRIVGGGAKSAIWRQIIADVLQLNLLELDVPSHAVATFGAAIAAGVGRGIFSDYDVAGDLIHANLVTEHSPAGKEQYKDNIAIYNELYPRLKDLYLI
ncbi:MAG: xylulokinase [Clostridiaceae bacterium]|jgi:xylulokinase|nr:xylulokinase [Clostridiaceae bacterium]